MGQHHLTPQPGKKHLTIVIGWDRPLGTYFVQVRRNDLDSSLIGRTRAMLTDWARRCARCLHLRDIGDETDYLWVGTHYGEITNPATAIRLIAPFAIIPADLHSTLSADAAHQGERRTNPIGDHLAAHLYDD